MGTWTVELPAHLDDMIRADLAEGRYSSVDEMVRVALDQLRDNRASAADRVRRAMEAGGDAIAVKEAGEAAMQEARDRLTRTIDHDPQPGPSLK